ncbi:MAG: hypothetical protein AB7E52_09230 [Bdellovibrionales bacterium]
MDSLVEEDFLKQHRFSVSRTETTYIHDGVSVPLIGQYRSSWSLLQVVSGLLNQQGTLTVLNPDQNGPIAFLTLDLNRSACFFYEKFVSTTDSALRVIAHPRDPEGMKRTHQETTAFENLVVKQMPGSPLEVDLGRASRGSMLSFAGHQEFLERHLGGSQNVSLKGVRIYTAKCVQPQAEKRVVAKREAAFDRLYTSSMLSKNPKVCEAVRALFSEVLLGGDVSPRTAPPAILTL